MHESTVTYLRHVFTETQGYFELTLIHPTLAKGANVKSRSYKIGGERVDWAKVAKLNQQGWGVYYGVSTARQRPAQGHRRREVDVLHLPCLWAEFDLKDGVYPTNEAIITRLYDFDFPPSFVITSGGGIHAIWRITPVEVTPENRPALKETVRGLALYLKSDTSATDLARVLRLPGSINTKPDRDGARCELVDGLSCRYTLKDFTWLRQYAAPIRRAIQRTLPRYRPDQLPPLVQAYLDSPGVQGSRNDSLNKAAFFLYSNEYSQSDAAGILLPKATGDGLSESEVLRTIQSAYSATEKADPWYLSPRNQTRMRAGDVLKEHLS